MVTWDGWTKRTTLPHSLLLLYYSDTHARTHTKHIHTYTPAYLLECPLESTAFTTVHSVIPDHTYHLLPTPLRLVPHCRPTSSFIPIRPARRRPLSIYQPPSSIHKPDFFHFHSSSVTVACGPASCPCVCVCMHVSFFVPPCQSVQTPLPCIITQSANLPRNPQLDSHSHSLCLALSCFASSRLVVVRIDYGGLVGSGLHATFCLD
ncbi:hypothetical protein B0J11DRAFT_524163 [Dendryphion nanum]|uniref:Uncharacterized protein n=1 Tax=Dendryphion nanum TaxID=256645 RepID=A0A9P9E540_9PLEO|nr:hypothetical protein B0J11DRAFT_524163 [Dendryphion nanum]